MEHKRKSRIYSTCVSGLNKIKISGEETDFVCGGGFWRGQAWDRGLGSVQVDSPISECRYQGNGYALVWCSMESLRLEAGIWESLPSRCMTTEWRER